MASVGLKEIDIDAKLEVRAVLLSKLEGVLLGKFASDFNNLLDHKVPYTDYGYKNLESFLRAMPDVVRFVYSKSNNDWRMFGIGDKTTYMSGHAKKAEGNPGADKDPCDKKRKRNRNRVRNGRRNSGKRSLNNDVENDAELVKGLNGLYSVVCPLKFHSPEVVLKDINWEGKVVNHSLSKGGYLFTRFSTLEAAREIIKKFSAKYGAKPAKVRVAAGREKSNMRNISSTAPNEVNNCDSNVDIYVGNISYQAEEAELMDLFREFHVKEIRFKKKDNSRFAFATFGTETEAVEAAVKFNKKNFKGSNLVCRLAHKPKPDMENPSVNMDQVLKLVEMGFPLEGSRRAVFFTHSSDLFEAITWMKDHQDDSDFNSPFTPPDSKGDAKPHSQGVTPNPGNVSKNSPSNRPSNSGDLFVPDEYALQQFLFINVPRDQAIDALKATNNNLQDASEWIVKNTEELLSAERAQSTTTKSSQSTTIKSSQSTTLKSSQSTSHQDFVPDPDSLFELLNNDIPRDRAVEALKNTGNNLEQAAYWLIENTPHLQKALREQNIDLNETETVEDVLSLSETCSKLSLDSTSQNTGSHHGKMNIRQTDGVHRVQPGPTKMEDDTTLSINGLVEIPPLEDDDSDGPPDLEYDDDDDDDDDDDITDPSMDSLSITTSDSTSQNVSIFVGNFPPGSKQMDLLELFNDYNPLKIKVINNDGFLNRTFAFVVLPNLDLAERAIEEMNGEMFKDHVLNVARAFIDRGYTELDDNIDDEVDDLVEEEQVETECQVIPHSISFLQELLEEVWPDAKILHTLLYKNLPVVVTSIVDDFYFFGHVLKFTQERMVLEEINENLNIVCSRRGPERVIPLHRCCARYEGSWFRAYNMGQVGRSNKQAVFFLDYGNIEELPPSELRRPLLDFMEAAPVVKAFELVDGSVWDYDIVEGGEVYLDAVLERHELSSVTKVTVIS